VKFQIALQRDAYRRTAKDSFRRCRYSHARATVKRSTPNISRSHDRIADEVRDPEKSAEIEGNRRGYSPSGTPAAQVHRCTRGDGRRFLRPCRWMWTCIPTRVRAGSVMIPKWKRSKRRWLAERDRPSISSLSDLPRGGYPLASCFSRSQLFGYRQRVASREYDGKFTSCRSRDAFAIIYRSRKRNGRVQRFSLIRYMYTKCIQCSIVSKKKE